MLLVHTIETIESRIELKRDKHLRSKIEGTKVKLTKTHEIQLQKHEKRKKKV